MRRNIVHMETSGLSVVTTPDGCVDVRLDRLVWRDLGFRLGPFAAHVDEVVVAAVAATLRLPSSGEPLRLEALEIGEVQLQGLSLRASGLPMRLPNASDPWRLDPIGRMTGTLHAFVTDFARKAENLTQALADGRLRAVQGIARALG